MGLQLNRNSIIEKFKKVHGEKYDYSMFSSYTVSNQIIFIICKKHGAFRQSVQNHARGYGCQKCAKEKVIRMSKERMVAARAKYVKICAEVHGNKYDYSRTDYNGSKLEVTIGCPKHGLFSIQAGKHKQGRGCQQCSEERRKKKMSEIMRNNKNAVKK